MQDSPPLPCTAIHIHHTDTHSRQALSNFKFVRCIGCNRLPASSILTSKLKKQHSQPLPDMMHRLWSLMCAKSVLYQ
jgi:hypothetical protein